MELGSRKTDFNTRASSKLTFFNRNAGFFVLFCFVFWIRNSLLNFFEVLRECLCLKNYIKKED